MGITHIFVSHAAKDEGIATELTQHLRNAGHETKVDTLDLALGDNAIAFMNEGIADAGAVIILFSKHTLAAKWQNLEIDAAVWSQVSGAGGRCIVVRLDDTPIPPVLGPKVYGWLIPGDRESLRKLVEGICSTLFSGQTTSSLVAEAFKPNSQNPFRHLRAEFFENQPELHAKTFALPDAVKVGALEDMKPCILEGSRGTGKSMLLLSLRARNFLLRHSSERNAPQHFGFYLKLTRGALCNAGRLEAEPHGSTIDTDVLTDVAEQELILQITESLFSELAYCIKHDMIDHDRLDERRFCEAADELLFDSQDGRAISRIELQRKLSDMHKRLADFIRRRFIYGESVSVPIATLDLEQIKRVVLLVRQYTPSLEASMFVVLLDEYENLFPYQRRIVNSLLKLGPPHISVKIAKKLASGDISGTTTGQELQEIHDYTRVPLVYNVENISERNAYNELLRHIITNMAGLEGAGTVNRDKFLPPFRDSEVDETLWLAEVEKLSKTTPEEFADLPDEKQRDKKTYYGEAATYRVLFGKRGRRIEKRFAGFSELALLSSGVIRYFQEFLSVGYHLTYGADPPPQGIITLPPSLQTKAVQIVSQHNLTTLSRNVERHGEELKYFLLDLGDCLRHKLLKHTSEPEAARLTLEDPEMLGDGTMERLKRILAVGEREGVFQTKEGLPAFKPKHSSDPQPAEFNICRVYAPVLQISPRLRWRTNIKCRQLQNLLQPGMRAQAVRALKNAVEKSRRSQATQDSLPFSPGDRE